MTPRKTHRWDPVNIYLRRCRHCGMETHDSRHPTRGVWFTKWTLGPRAWSTLLGDKTPPCTPTRKATT